MPDILIDEDDLRRILEDDRTLLLELDDHVYTITARGRQPIGVNQAPSSGSIYPFLKCSDSIANLLGDFYLSYPDPVCSYQAPFSIVWLYGFGSEVTAAPEWAPTPTHEHDLLIKDNNDVVVFDSTLAESYHIKLWGNRLLVVEWKDDTRNIVCRCTIHVSWSPANVQDDILQIYDTNITPAVATLDPRTYNRLPLRVDSFQIGLTKITGQVEFESGYNIGLSVVADVVDTVDVADLLADLEDESVPTIVAGKRVIQRVNLQANPGDGLGQVPGCEEVEPVLKVFGGARPDSAGNVNLDFTECLRAQRPVSLISEDPRQFQYLATGLTEAESKAALEMHNDCGACNECDFFVRTYSGLKRQWTLWQNLAATGEAVRDLIQENKDRWLLQKSCREANPLRVILMPEPSRKVTGGALYCNASKCCLVPVTFRFTFEHYRSSVLVDDPEFRPTTCDVLVEGSSQTNGEERYAWSGTWPVFDVVLDYANPQTTSRVSFRICMPDGTPADNLRMTVAILADDPADGCVLPVQTVPDNIATLWPELVEDLPPVRALMASQLIPLQTNNAFCANCEC